MGIRDDLNYGLAAFGIQLPARLNLEEKAGALAENPFRNTVAMVSAAAVVFYTAERAHNPKVRDIYDALVYCSTNISVGYSDIIARTPIGKLIGSTLMTIGPAMAARTLDGPKSRQLSATQEQILATLREIAAKMEVERQTPSVSSKP